MQEKNKLAVPKSLSNDVKELDSIYGDDAFQKARMLPLKNILLLLTIGGSVIILVWQFFDRFYLDGNDASLHWLGVITIVVYVVNLLVAVTRKTDQAYRQHLTPGFYFGATFLMLLAVFTGASQSPYRFGLFFILIGWFVLALYLPELIIHSLVLVLMFLAGMMAQPEFQLVDYELAKVIFLSSGTLPLVKAGLINFDLMELRPNTGFDKIFQKQEI